MTSRLALLHSRLTRLRRARRAVVMLSALAAIGAALLLSLFAVLLLDWLFGLDVYQRLIVMILVGGGLAYFARKFLRECGRGGAGEIQTALWVEGQHQIDSDLVAAIQFERAAAGDVASRRLATAVVDYVATATPTINVFQGFSAGPLLRRLALFGGCVLVGAALVFVVPNHVRAFGQRLLLGSKGYPTRTQIERVSVGHTIVFERGDQDTALNEAKAAEAAPITFTAVCSGALPASAVAHVHPVEGSGPGTRIALKRIADSSAEGTVYRGELPRLHEDLRYWITAGDARTAMGVVRMIALPTVEVEIMASPPAYAAASSVQVVQAAGGGSVLEGSTVELNVRCTNGKVLKSVLLFLQGSTGTNKVELTAGGEERGRWTLPAGDSALASIRGDLRYEVQATDVDGLSPLVPVRGVIRVHPDAPPTAAASVVHRLVLPDAQPVIGYRVGDDQGIARLELVVDVERAEQLPMDEAEGGATSVATPVVAPPAPPRIVAETERFEIPLPQAVVAGDQLPLTGSYALALAPLGLAKGDRIKLTLAATDYRGENAPGVSAASDSLMLEVADESQVLSAIRQADERSEAQLNEIIRRQLGVGQEP